MTCIIGLVEEGNIYIGGDSAAAVAWEIITRADQKVFTKGDFIMGFTTSFRMGQLLRYAFTPPAMQEGQDVYDYMVTPFIDAVRECLKTGGFAGSENGVESGGTFLVGTRGRLFTIYSDYQVGESTHPFAAVGSGAQVALGSLFSTKGTPQERIQRAPGSGNVQPWHAWLVYHRGAVGQ